MVSLAHFLGAAVMILGSVAVAQPASIHVDDALLEGIVMAARNAGQEAKVSLALRGRVRRPSSAHAASTHHARAD